MRAFIAPERWRSLLGHQWCRKSGAEAALPSPLAIWPCRHLPLLPRRRRCTTHTRSHNKSSRISRGHRTSWPKPPQQTACGVRQRHSELSVPKRILGAGLLASGRAGALACSRRASPIHLAASSAPPASSALPGTMVAGLPGPPPRRAREANKPCRSRVAAALAWRCGLTYLGAYHGDGSNRQM